jgi:hypothetical protein
MARSFVTLAVLIGLATLPDAADAQSSRERRLRNADADQARERRQPRVRESYATRSTPPGVITARTPNQWGNFGGPGTGGGGGGGP